MTTAWPQWLAAAILGAILAVLGYVGKQLAEWLAGIRAAQRRRRARLAELFALVRAGDTAFKVQCDNRDRLVELIQARDPASAAAAESYDRLLARAFPAMSPDEQELHAVVRAMTVHTFKPLNDALLLWLAEDTDFRVREPGDTPRGKLAEYLADLEAHLLLWRAKFNAWIPEHPERALVYMADEQRHGVPFPKNGAQIIGALLHKRG